MSEGGVGDTAQQQQDNRWCHKCRSILWNIIHMIFTCCGLPLLICGFIVGTNDYDSSSEKEGGSLTEKLLPPESSVRKAEPEGKSAPPYDDVSEQQPSGEEFFEMEKRGSQDKKLPLPSVAEEEEEANAGGGRGSSMLTVPLGGGGDNNDNDDDDEKYFSPKSDNDDDDDNDNNSSDDENAYLSPKSNDFDETHGRNYELQRFVVSPIHKNSVKEG